ncbi:MAG TPA: GyrI-like domain-containing protein, partial [Asticcacaulis sp.]|nr:GyrI-like domain-containing protein [Asticcacaulis sp.]
MIDTPETVLLPAQKTAMIRLTVPSSEIRKHMGEGLTELRKVLADQGITPAGAWFTHHFKVPDETFDFEICLPVDKDVASQGRVQPGEIRSTRVVRTTCHGNYDRLGAGWGEFMGWVKEQNLNTAGDFWEIYAVNPDDSADPADWRTQLNV